MSQNTKQGLPKNSTQHKLSKKSKITGFGQTSKKLLKKQKQGFNRKLQGPK